VDALWCFREGGIAADAKRRSAGNLKPVWTGPGGDVREWVRHATQVKNVWVPMGE